MTRSPRYDPDENVSRMAQLTQTSVRTWLISTAGTLSGLRKLAIQCLRKTRVAILFSVVLGALVFSLIDDFLNQFMIF
jgi:hypothetical protein